MRKTVHLSSCHQDLLAVQMEMRAKKRSGPAHATKKANAVHCQFIDVPRRRLLQRKKTVEILAKKITVASVIQQPVECLTKCMCQFSWTSVDTILQVEKIKLWTQIISSSVEECSIKYCTHMHSRHRERSSIPHWRDLHLS